MSTPDPRQTESASSALPPRDMAKDLADEASPVHANTGGLVHHRSDNPTSTELAADRRNAEEAAKQGKKGRASERAAEPEADYQDKMTTTRSGAIWATTIFSLIVLVLLIIFIAQNQDTTTLRYFGWEGTVNVGLTVLAAAVAGGIIVALAGAARIIALKAQKRRQRKATRR